ncbi:uncharacterized protein LOC130123766 isoform X2 [Lampris incognitus]|uniref:uncharacterized protein LOC130123766 isoform X2 n=1 Tax=Lampris incognitus TaxID=2546036 RepID=UPI0024B58142|nr:uncharacterized protein LOC130123766 isoform X2 [Lampris incognitus]
MDSTIIATDPFRRFQDDGYKNWIKTTLALAHLKTRLGSFLENETETFHRALRDKIQLKGQECSNNCNFGKWAPRRNQIPPLQCKVCAPWRDEIWANHTSKGALVYWNNCTPKLWPKEKWEVAKVYMPKGKKTQRLGKDFDISAFLNLMSFCKHFEQYVQMNLLTKVTFVRNQVMHSADFSVSLEQLEEFLQQIKNLGRALERHSPEFNNLSMRIEELQNLDFSLILSDEVGLVLHSASTHPIKPRDANHLLDMELQIMKEKMEFLFELHEASSENRLTLEELQCVRVFLERNKDLRERLLPQWERLMEVQEQQGQQINSLTGRVEELEKQTPNLDSDYMSTKMHKNHLLEEARKWGWPEPSFSEIREPTGFRGKVRVNNQIFTGHQICRSKILAHQDVAKEALQQLSAEITSDQGDGEDNIAQSQSATEAGPCFFYSVTVALHTEVSSDRGCDKVEAVESVYKKIASVFGLDGSASGSSYKEQVLQYCQRHGVPPPEKINRRGVFSLHLNGEITFYDLEGSKRKKQAQQQAAKAALQGLSGVLEEKRVLGENYVGALKELVDTWKLGRECYDCSDTPESSGERSRWVANQERDEETEARKRIKHQSGEERKDGPCFFYSVTVALDTKVSSDHGCDTMKAAESVYKKIASVFGLDGSASGSSYKEQVLQYCQRHGVPPPEEISTSDPFSLHLNGEITFYDLEGSKKKKQAQQQAAKAALQGLSGVLEEKKVLGENYVGALKELVDTWKLGREHYDCSDTLATSGERARWVANQERGEETQVRQRIKHQSGEERKDGPCFFYSVTVALDTKVSSDRGCDTMKAAESVYKKIASVFGLDGSASGSPYKEQVLQYCQRHGVPPREEISTSDPFSLHLNGEITFYDLEGSKKKKQAQQQAAKAALQGLSGVLEEKKVLGENYVGALKELVDTWKLGREHYDCSDTLATSAEKVRWVANQERGEETQVGQRIKHQSGEERKDGSSYKEQVLQYCQRHGVPPPEEINTCGLFSLHLKGEITFYDLEGSKKKKQAQQQAATAALQGLGGVLEEKRVLGENYVGALKELVDAWKLGRERYDCSDTPESSGERARWVANQDRGEETQIRQRIKHQSGEERKDDDGQFLGCVTVTVKKQLKTHEASSQKEALQVAYCSLLKDLSLGPTATTAEEKQLVLEFFTRTTCQAPEEEERITTNGEHQCTLKIDGKFTFYSPVGALRKQTAEQLAAKEALKHLEGLLGGMSTKLPEENYKGRLQELVALHKFGDLPQYTTTDRSAPAAGH